MTSLEVFQVSAFADSPTSGNPAGVVLVAGELDNNVRQRVAARVGLSETAFVEPLLAPGSDGSSAGSTFSGGSLWRLRWYTPTTEVPLCGHATLAAAAVLFSVWQRLKFATASGLLVVSRGGGSDGTSGTQVAPGGGDQLLLLRMSLPRAFPCDRLPPSLRTELIERASIGGVAASRALTALLWPCLHSLKVTSVPQAPHHQGPGQAPDWTSTWLASVVHFIGFAAPLKYLLVVLKPGVVTGAHLAALTPDTAAMRAAVPAEELTGVIVAAAGGTSGDGDDDSGDRPSSYDFCLRFFGPWAGIDEDPVTGSAFSVAAPWFASAPAAGHAPGLKLRMCARQVSPRGGDVWLDLGWEPGRVIVEGQAVMAAKQTLRLDEL